MSETYLSDMFFPLDLAVTHLPTHIHLLKDITIS